MKINTLLFFTALSITHSSHSMDNPPQHELSQQLYKKIEKVLFSNSSTNELKKLIPNKKVANNLSFEQKNRLLNKGRRYLELLQRKKNALSCKSNIFCIAFMISIVSCVVLGIICLENTDNQFYHSKREYNSKIYDCKNRCTSYDIYRVSGVHNYLVRSRKCSKVRKAKWLTPDAYDLWEYLGSPEKDLSYDTNKCNKIWDLMMFLCKDSCSQIQPPPASPTCHKYFYCDKPSYPFFYIFLIPIGLAILYNFSMGCFNGWNNIKRYMINNKIKHLEKIFCNNKCCICYKKNALNGNIPCKLKHPNEAICNDCLKNIDRCPLCRKNLIV